MLLTNGNSAIYWKPSGKRLGRPEGSKSKVRVLEGRREEILAWLAQGESVAVISERMGVCKKTFYTWWKGESVQINVPLFEHKKGRPHSDVLHKHGYLNN